MTKKEHSKLHTGKRGGKKEGKGNDEKNPMVSSTDSRDYRKPKTSVAWLKVRRLYKDTR